MKNYKIKTQKLLCPQHIPSITPQQEMAIIDHLDVFEANGFGFDVDSNRSNGKRVRIKSLPMSINPQSKVSYEFGADEILELATILSEESKLTFFNVSQSQCDKIMIRPAKVRSVFASRACRGAIMIGKPLTRKEMRVVVDNIHSLDQPWNCPHGRPTMRHLFDLSMLNEKLREKTQNSNQYGAFAFA